MTKPLANPKRRELTRSPEERRQLVALICAQIAADPKERVVYAAAKCGVSKSTLYDWLAGDEELALMMEVALGQAHADDAKKLEHLIESDAKSARVQLQLMQCRYPKEYAGPTKQVEHSGHTTSQRLVVQLGPGDLPRLKDEARAQLAVKVRDGEEDEEG